MKESDIQKSIIDYLRIKKCIVVKFPSVGIYNKKTDSYIPQPQRGVSDLIFCTKEGRYGAIEVKNKPNKPSEAQVAFIESIKNNNGLACIAYSLDDVMNLIK